MSDRDINLASYDAPTLRRFLNTQIGHIKLNQITEKPSLHKLPPESMTIQSVPKKIRRVQTAEEFAKFIAALFDYKDNHRENMRGCLVRPGTFIGTDGHRMVVSEDVDTHLFDPCLPQDLRRDQALLVRKPRRKTDPIEPSECPLVSTLDWQRIHGSWDSTASPEGSYAIINLKILADQARAVTKFGRMVNTYFPIQTRLVLGEDMQERHFNPRYLLHFAEVFLTLGYEACWVAYTQQNALVAKCGETTQFVMPLLGDSSGFEIAINPIYREDNSYV